MKEIQLSRRRALQVLGATSVFSTVLAACGGGGKSEPDSCSDVSGLSEADKTSRSALQYVDKSPQADKLCKNCQLFQPAPEPSQCGGCQVVKGPIHPNGYCTAWAQKA